MIKNRIKWITMLCLVLIAAAGCADQIRYGFTCTEIRVRNAPSLDAGILDHLLADRCVLIQSEADAGKIHFIGVTYRDAAGELSTGWVAQREGNREYVIEISPSQYASEFGLEIGTLPDDEAGTSGGTYHVNISQPARETAAVTDSASSDKKTTENKSAITGGQNTSDIVRYCQTVLTDLGLYYGEVTGNIGTKTKKAIQLLQKQEGLPVTGELDEGTIRRLRESEESGEEDADALESTPAPAPEPDDVPEQDENDYAEPANPSSVSVVSGTLTIDSTGDTVYQIQERLKLLGYYTGSLTGHYGSKTAAAVKAFQKAYGIKQTGDADSETVSLILYGRNDTKSESEQQDTADDSGEMYQKGDQSDVIAEMQTALTELRIYSGDITGHFGSKTKDAVQTFQRKNGLTVSGELDSITISAIRAAVSNSVNDESETEDNDGQDSGNSGIYTLDWFTAKNNGVFPYLGLNRGSYATLKDLGTGKSLRVYIQSAGYHLDVEPATASDTSVFCAVYGVSSASSISYKRRPALLTTSEGYSIVCSIYGTPHGQQVITNNNFNGQFCVHFLNSKTSGSGNVDSDHQSAIQSAISMMGGSAKKIQSVSDLSR